MIPIHSVLIGTIVSLGGIAAAQPGTAPPRDAWSERGGDDARGPRREGAPQREKAERGEGSQRRMEPDERRMERGSRPNGRQHGRMQGGDRRGDRLRFADLPPDARRRIMRWLREMPPEARVLLRERSERMRGEPREGPPELDLDRRPRGRGAGPSGGPSGGPGGRPQGDRAPDEPMMHERDGRPPERRQERDARPDQPRAAPRGLRPPGGDDWGSDRQNRQPDEQQREGMSPRHDGREEIDRSTEIDVLIELLGPAPGDGNRGRPPRRERD